MGRQVALADGKQLRENLTLLRERTGLPVLVCKQALDAAGGGIDAALLWLRANGRLAVVSVPHLLERCAPAAGTWARAFLDTTLDSGELRTYYESGTLDVIQENYYEWYVIGMTGRCPWLTFKEEVKHLSDAEHDEFGAGVVDLYDRAVARLLPEYVRADWKRPG